MFGNAGLSPSRIAQVFEQFLPVHVHTLVYRLAVIVHERLADNKGVQIEAMPKVRSDRERTDFGRRLKDARTAAGMTQAYVCKQLGFSQGTLAELESTSLSSSLTPRLANLYGVNAMWLATGEGERLAAQPNDADEAALLQAFRSLKQGSRERAEAVAFLRGMAAVAAPMAPSGKQQVAGAR